MQDTMRSHFSGSLAASLIMLTLACGGEDLVLPSDEAPGSEAPAHLEMAGGDDQVGAPGAALAQPVRVRLVDDSGRGIPDREVTWIVTTGDGTVAPGSGMTDPSGYAAAQWTLGDPGPNSLTALAAGVGQQLTFTATATGGDDGGGDAIVVSASLSTLSVDPSAIEVGSGRSTIRVTVRDEQGAPVPGAVVTLSATGSGNTLAQPAGPTGADGVAVGTLRSTVAGTKDVTAVINGAVQINQTAQVFVTISPATRIEAVEGDDQEARAGSAVAVPPAVRVTNARGQPVAGYGVTFVVSRGGGTVSGASQTTNADGIARVGSWMLGSATDNRLEARAGSLNGSPVVFRATATEEPPPPPPPPAAEPHHFIFLEPPHDVEENEEFTVRVAILDVDGDIVPLSGIEIYIGLFQEGREHPSNDLLRGDRFEDTRNGIAEFRFRIENRRSGTERYRMRALSDELPQLGPHGPEPWLFSQLFTVRGD
jgi:hypothetical protein